MVSRKIILLALALVVMGAQEALALSGSQVYERVKDSVVVVMAYDRAGKAVGLGSGVALPSGEIVTNYHVVKTGVRYKVGQRGKTAPASLKGSNPDNDLALLLAPGLTAAPARLGQASRLKVGEQGFAVGSPQGLELSLSEGIVSQLRGGPPPLIQTTVAISPGSSGGGLFNDQGELVGIMTFQLKEGQNLNFAVPVEWVGQLAQSVRKGLVFVGPVDITDQELATSAGVWLKQAMELTGTQDYQALLAHARRWTEAMPSHPYAWCYLGFAYEAFSRHQQAVEAYREAVRLKPNFSSAWYAVGSVYARSGNHSAALEAEKELRRFDPKQADELLKLIMKP